MDGPLAISARPLARAAELCSTPPASRKMADRPHVRAQARRSRDRLAPCSQVGQRRHSRSNRPRARPDHTPAGQSGEAGTGKAEMTLVPAALGDTVPITNKMLTTANDLAVISFCKTSAPCGLRLQGGVSYSRPFRRSPHLSCGLCGRRRSRAQRNPAPSSSRSRPRESRSGRSRRRSGRPVGPTAPIL
jgi:hypothetical protein